MRLTKKLLALLLVGIMLCTAGCGLQANITIDEKGNEIVSSEQAYYTKAELKEVCDTTAEYKTALSTLKTKTIDGTVYYIKNVSSGATAQTVDESGGYFTSSKFEMPQVTYGLSSDELSLEQEMFADATFVNYVIHFPYKVLAANGTISADGYAVTYDIASMFKKHPKAGFRLYAVFNQKAIDETSLFITGVNNNKTYSSNQTVDVYTNGTVTELKVNGKSISGRGTTLTANGNYTVTATLLSGTTKTVTFAIKKYYKLTYKVNGGKKLTTTYKKVRWGNKYGTLATPKRTGYKFLGWYTKKSGGTKVTANTVCKKSVTLYAHWKKK